MALKQSSKISFTSILLMNPLPRVLAVSISFFAVSILKSIFSLLSVPLPSSLNLKASSVGGSMKMTVDGWPLFTKRSAPTMSMTNRQICVSSGYFALVSNRVQERLRSPIPIASVINVFDKIILLHSCLEVFLTDEEIVFAVDFTRPRPSCGVAHGEVEYVRVGITQLLCEGVFAYS